jgi:hypothetical protein
MPRKEERHPKSQPIPDEGSLAGIYAIISGSLLLQDLRNGLANRSQFHDSLIRYCSLTLNTAGGRSLGRTGLPLPSTASRIAIFGLERRDVLSPILGMSHATIAIAFEQAPAGPKYFEARP